MDETTSLGLTQLYDLFGNPIFARSHRTSIAEVAVGEIGKVTVGTAYYPHINVAIPILLLSEEQVRVLREDNGIYFKVKRRKHPTGEKVYIGFPKKPDIERMKLI